MLLPKFCISLASELGMPLPVVKAIRGFYDGQVKIFKLGQVYGQRVLHTNGVLQGCAFSVLFANIIFSVFAHHIASVSDGQFASFIDDTKMWTKVSDFPTLVTMANELSAFDSSVGQSQNDRKVLSSLGKRKTQVGFFFKLGNASPRLNKPVL